jgi:hypothetical protein
MSGSDAAVMQQIAYSIDDEVFGGIIRRRSVVPVVVYFGVVA